MPGEVLIECVLRRHVDTQPGSPATGPAPTAGAATRSTPGNPTETAQSRWPIRCPAPARWSRPRPTAPHLPAPARSAADPPACNRPDRRPAAALSPGRGVPVLPGHSGTPARTRLRLLANTIVRTPRETSPASSVGGLAEGAGAHTQQLVQQRRVPDGDFAFGRRRPLPVDHRTPALRPAVRLPPRGLAMVADVTANRGCEAVRPAQAP